MRWVNYNGVRYLQFPALAKLPDFFHGIFLSTTIDDAGHRRSFNLGLNQLDAESVVQQNRYRMLTCFGQPIGIYARQVHGSQVGVLTGKNHHRADSGVRLEGDALATRRRNSALVIQVADCQPVLIADPVRKVAANVHSGWRGSIANVIGQTIQSLTAEFGCRPENLVAGIGPSLGPCCAEFIHYRREIPQRYWQYRHHENLFDFWRLSIDQLVDAGVPTHSISTAEMCTRCNQHQFFSYRGQQQSGRFAGVIGLR